MAEPASGAGDGARHVFLVPGFFGFTAWGELRYFGHVQSLLAATWAGATPPVAVHVVGTPPTSSLPRRAAHLAEVIAASADGDGAIHLVGHSSGGLDARLLAAPGVGLPTAVDVERIARRVRSIVTVSAPHYGTPLAAFFTGLLGQKVLELLSVATIALLRFGHLPLGVVLRLGAAFARVARLGQPSASLLDELLEELLGDFSPERRAAVAAYLRDVEKDQALLQQLTPDGMDLFNAATRDRPGVRYGCVVSQARKPGLGSAIAAGLDPGAQATHAIYAALHRLAGQTSVERLPRPTREQTAGLRSAYGRLPDRRASDGIVPTRAQLWGDLVHATVGDHLDVLGHFGDTTRTPPHVDWLVTGSGFDRRRFEALWTGVVRYLTG